MHQVVFLVFFTMLLSITACSGQVLCGRIFAPVQQVLVPQCKFLLYQVRHSWTRHILSKDSLVERNRDCCSWDWVAWANMTDDVIGLDLSCRWLHRHSYPNSTLFLLPHLQRLNLAFIDFDCSAFSPEFSQFSSMAHLNLSFAPFLGAVRPEISYLSKLEWLDLTGYHHTLWFDNPSLRMLLQNLTELWGLVLDGMNWYSILPSSWMNISST